MAGMDEGQAWLLSCLNGTLEANSEIRKAAEQALSNASSQSGFGVALAKVVVNKELPMGLRQLAAVLLKQYVKQHWQEGEKNYMPPTASSEDKTLIRSLLIQALDDSSGKIRTAVSMAIASIANLDWPEEWPHLMDYLLNYIRDQSDMNKVNGALKCLALFSGDLDDIHLPQIIPVLFPSLYTIVSSSNIYGLSFRRRALSILHSCISTLGVMSGAYQAKAESLMTPMLKAWMEQFAFILSPPVLVGNPDDWGVRAEVLKSLMPIVQYFPKIAAAEFPAVLAPFWQTFVSTLKVFEQASVNGVEDSYAGAADSDGNEQSLETFTIQLLEFLTTVVGQPRFRKVVEKHVSEIAYYTIGFMQMTEDQVQCWSSDPNQYVADEDDVTYSSRVSGILLLEELVQMYELDAVKCITHSVQKRIEEAAHLKAAGQPNWWKLRESAILTLGTISESLMEEQADLSANFNLEGFLQSLLIEDLGPVELDSPFLQGRALWAASKFASKIEGKMSEQFVYASIQGLSTNSSVPVKIGACRALSRLFSSCNLEWLRPQIRNIFLVLVNLLKEASDETLHLILETIQAAIKADSEVAAAIEKDICPLLLDIWVRSMPDPFISIDVLEVLETLKDVPGCLEPLLSRVLPFVGPVLANPQRQSDGLVAAALDLITMLLKNTPTAAVRAIHDAVFCSVIGIAIQSDDHSELQNATECLASFVQEAGEELLSWSSDGNHSMQMLLDASARLLNPDLDSSSSLFVGNFISQLILKLSTHMAPHLKVLVTALVQRMKTADILGLKNSFVLVFARLVHMSAPNVVQFIDLLLSIPVQDYNNAFVYVMTEWCKQQGEIQGAYQIKVTTTALALLLSSMHPQLSNVIVQGRLIQSSVNGIMTRSRAKSAPDQYSMVPLHVKILVLLVDVLVEMQEVENGNTDEDDWEEVGDDDDDDDDVDETDNMQSSISSKPNGKSPFKPLDDVRHLLTEEAYDGDYKEDPCAINDPISKINLPAYVAEYVRTFARDNNPLVDHLYQELPERQKRALKLVLVS